MLAAHTMTTIQQIVQEQFDAPTQSRALSAAASSPDHPSIRPLPVQPGHPTMRLCPGRPGGLNFHRPQRPAPAPAAMATGVSRPLCAGKDGGIQFPYTHTAG
jgi:hypothetical protein